MSEPGTHTLAAQRELLAMALVLSGVEGELAGRLAGAAGGAEALAAAEQILARWHRRLDELRRAAPN